jgi:8-oxo-dGTP diphosphatase
MMDWTGWTARQNAVLVLVVDQDHGKVLFIHKKRGLGQGKVNAPGGKVEPGERWIDAAVRETQEETGLTPLAPRLTAQIAYQFVDGYSLDVRVFTADTWTGELRACDEAHPFWCHQDNIPWTTMWADDALWVPPILSQRTLEGRFVFDGDTMNEATIVLRPRSAFDNNG